MMGPPLPPSYKIVASNLSEDLPHDFSTLTFDDNARSELRNPELHGGYWEIIFPIRDKSHRRPIGFIHAEVSLQLVGQIVGTFSQIAFLGALISTGLLIGLLSYYLRRMIENERRLRKAESGERQPSSSSFTRRSVSSFSTRSLRSWASSPRASPMRSARRSTASRGNLQLLHDEVADKHSQDRIDIINSQVSRNRRHREGLSDLDPHAAPAAQARRRQGAHRTHHEARGASCRGHSRPRCRSTFPTISPTLRVVPTDLEQVLLNLTTNAIDAIDALGTSSGPRELSFEARQGQDGSRRTLELVIRGYGSGHCARGAQERPEALLHDEGPGTGHGPRSSDLPASRQALRRQARAGIDAWQGNEH